MAFIFMRIWWRIICGLFRALFSCGSRRGTPDLSADVCLVTGAGQGLGRQLALQLAGCGATLVLWDINGDKVRAVADEIREAGREAHPYVVDCSKKEEVYRTAAQVQEEVGDVAVLVNNAGVICVGQYVSGELTDEDIVRTFSINALAPFWTVRAFLPWMLDNDYGYIVNIASVAAFMGLPYCTDYCASKAALRSFSESLRFELLGQGKKNISVTCVLPDALNTKMFEESYLLKKYYKTKRAKPTSPGQAAQLILAAMARKQFSLCIPANRGLLPFFYSVLPHNAVDPVVQEVSALFHDHRNKEKES